MTDLDEATYRVRQYGKRYKEFSGRCSLAQFATILFISFMFLTYDNRHGLTLCLIYMLISVMQYAIGTGRYLELFLRCSDNLHAGLITQRDINNKGVNAPSDFLFSVKTLLFYVIISCAFYLIWN